MPRSTNTAKARIVELLQTYPERKFTSREIAEALDMKMNSTSAFISGYLVSIPISRVGETKHAGGGWTPQYQYDPNKILVEAPRKPSKKKPAPKQRLPERVPKAQTVLEGKGMSPRFDSKSVDAHYASDMYAKVVYRDEKMVVLVTESKDIIKGHIMQE